MNQSQLTQLISRHARVGALVTGFAVLSACPWTTLAAPAGIAAAPAAAQAGQIKVTGTVTDATGEPLIGASVLIKGTSTGAATDFDGNFSLTAPADAELEVTYVGYKSAIVKIDGRSTIDIVLQEDSEILEEVVVVGYGTQKKESLTGAVSVVDSKMLSDKGGLSNPAQALQGQVPGVIITRSSSAPGAEGWNMKLRGSFSRNNQAPLVIIDGIESEDFANLNPNDIQSINFLKDASAAIYGSKAAGGVIIVQTKSAAEGKVKVEYGGSVTAKFLGLSPKDMTLDEWADMVIQGFTNDNNTGHNGYKYAKLAKAYHGYYLDNNISSQPVDFGSVQDFCFFDTNMYDALWGTAATTSHELAVSGGTDKHTYRISGRYMYDGSNLKWGKNNNQKFNIRFNDKIKFSSKLSLESNLSYILNNNVSPTNITAALQSNIGNSNAQPGLPLTTTDGKPYAWGNWRLPTWQCENGGENKLHSWNISIGETLRYVFNDYFDAVATLGYNHSSAVRDIQNLSPSYYNYAGNKEESQAKIPDSDTYYTKSTGVNNLYSVNAYLNWKQTFGLHNAAAMAGVQYSYKDYDYYLVTAYNIQSALGVPNGLGEVKLLGDDKKKADRWQEAQMSYFARLNYNYDGRYLLEGNFRYDGSSKFRPENRWAFFWGVSGGWRITQEAFLRDQTILSDLKLRASYGTVGNQGGISRYDGIQLYNYSPTSGALMDGKRLTVVDTNGELVSTDRTWETIKNTNVALDFAFINNHLRGTVEAFWKRCDNMLIGANYPGILGDKAPSANNGAFRAHGYEGQLTWSHRIGNVDYHFGGTVTYTTNKLVDNGGDAAITAGVVGNREGYPLNSVFGLRYCGKIQSADQLEKYLDRYEYSNTISMPHGLRLGDNMYEDVNGDGKLDAQDLVYLGTDDPKLSFSFNAGLSWKGFDVSVVFQGVGDRTIWRGESGTNFITDNKIVPFRSWYTNTSNTSVGNVWSPDNRDARFPQYTNKQEINNYNWYCSSFSVENGAYLRLKNVTIGYTFPASLMEKTHFMSSARIYVTGTDLWESTKMNDGYDPEASRLASGFGRYPFTRNVTFGLNLSF